MAQVVYVHFLNPALLLDLRPETPNLLHRLAGRVAGKQPRRAAQYRQLALADYGRGFVRDRYAVHPALFCHRRWLRPAHVFKVELFKPRLTHLAQTGTGQHAHADDVGCAGIGGRIQCGGKAGDFLL